MTCAMLLIWPILLRMGRLPEACIVPPETREFRELARDRAKLGAIRSGQKAQIHAVLAKAGVLIAVSDLFGVTGRQRLGQVATGPRSTPNESARCSNSSTFSTATKRASPTYRPAVEHPPRLSSGSASARHRTDAGGGVRRRDR